MTYRSFPPAVSLAVLLCLAKPAPGGVEWSAASLSAWISSATGQEVRIGRIGTNFLNEILLRDVSVRGAARITCPEARIRFSFLRFLPIPSGWAGPGGISLWLKNPRVVLTPRRGRRDGLFKPLGALPVALSWENASLRLVDAGRPWDGLDVNGIHGRLAVTSRGLQWRAGLDSPGRGQIAVSGRLPSEPGAPWTIELSARGADIAHLQGLCPNALKARLPGRFSGRLTGKGRAEGVRASGPSRLSWSFEGEVRHGSYRAPGSERAIPLEGAFALGPGEARISRGLIAKSLKLEGTVSDPWTRSRTLRLAVRGDAVDIASMKDMVPENLRGARWPLRGRGRVALEIAGPARDPQIGGSFSFSGAGAAGLELGEVAGRLRASPSAYELELRGLGGEVRISGIRSADKPRFSISASRLDLASLAAANGWLNISGIAELNLEHLGRGEAASAEGELEIGGVAWGRHRLEAPIRARLVYRESQLLVKSDGETLYLEAGLEGARVSLRRFHLVSPDFWVKGSGSVSGPERQLDLDLDVNGFALADWPPLAARYPEAAGRLSFKGRARGTWGEPLMEGHFAVPDLRFSPETPAWRLAGTLKWDGRALALTETTAGPAGEDALTGSEAAPYRFELSWRPASRAVQVLLSLSEADPALFRDAARIRWALEGSASGVLEGRWENGRFEEARSRILWKRGRAGPFAFEEARMALDGNAEDGFTLSEFQVLQASGAFSAEGRYLPGESESAWTLKGQLKKTAAGEQAVDGEFEAKGAYRPREKTLRGEIASPALFLNGHGLGPAEARFTLDRTRLELSSLLLGPLGGEFRLAFATREVVGRFSARRQDLIQTLKRWGLTENPEREALWPSGLFDADIALSGTLDDPRIESVLSFAEGTWREVSFNGEARVSYAGRAAAIESLRLRTASGGEARFEGLLNFREEEPLQLTGEILSFSVEDALRLAKLPPLWKGLCRGAVQLEGPLSSVRAVVALEGRHERWGPLPEGPLEARLHFDGKVWDIQEALFGVEGGHLRLARGSFVYLTGSQTGRMRLLSEIRNIRLGPVAFFGGLEVVGQWAPPAGKSRTLDWDLSADARGLWVNQEKLDGRLARCRIRDKQLTFVPLAGGAQQLSGEISFAQFPRVDIGKLLLVRKGGTRVALDGTFSPGNWRYALDCQSVEAETLMSLFDATFPASGQVDLIMTAAGPPAEPTLEGSFLWAAGRIHGIPFDTARADFFLSGRTVSLKNLKAVKDPGFFIKGEGRLPLAGRPGPGTAGPAPATEFDFTLEEGDLKILEEIWEDCRKARGRFHGEASMKIRKGRPVLSGNLEVRDARIDARRYFEHLSQGRALLELAGNRLVVRSLSARLGDGRAVVGGWVDFEGGTPAEYHLFLRTPDEKGIGINVPQLTIPPGPLLKRFSLFQKALGTPSAGEPRIDLVLEGHSSEPTVRGVLTLHDTTFTYPPQPGRLRKPPQWLADFLNATRWDVTFAAGDNTQYANELVEADVTGSLRLLGRLNSLTVTGRVESDRGAIVYAGEQFRIRQAALDIQSMAPPPGIETSAPTTIVHLETEAEKDVFVPGGIGADTVILTIAKAPLGEIRPRFQLKSNPGLGSEKAMQIALGLPVATPDLVTGQPTAADPALDRERYLRAAVVQLFDASLASPLARAIARRSGLVDYIRVYYQPADEEPSAASEAERRQSASYLKGSGLAFGKELTRRLFANYKFRVDEFQSKLDLRHEFEVAYRLKNNLFLKGVTELDSKDTLGRSPDRRAILENRWRFWPPGMGPEMNPPSAPKPAPPQAP